MHFTLNRDQQVNGDPGLDVQYIPGHSLGGGYTRHIAQLAEGDTADNPASSKGPIYGPCVVVYDVAPSGIQIHVDEDASAFYKSVNEGAVEGIMMKLRSAHRKNKGKGDQGAHNVWAAVTEIIGED